MFILDKNSLEDRENSFHGQLLLYIETSNKRCGLAAAMIQTNGSKSMLTLMYLMKDLAKY